MEKIDSDKDAKSGTEETHEDIKGKHAEDRVKCAEEHEEEEEDIFCSLGGFMSDILGSLSSPSKPLPIEGRHPRPLSSFGQELPHILRLLQDLIMYDGEDPEVTYGPEITDAEGRLAIVSHLLAALVTTVEPQHLRRLATRLISDTSIWISRIFRSFDSTAFLHEDAREGAVRVCRMLLHNKYPKYSSDGYDALYTRPPVIYTSTAVRPGLPQHISSMLGLGTGCLRVVPCNTLIGSPIAMDTSALERMMTEDVNAQRKPLLVIANVGGGLVGGVDNVTRLQELCSKHDAWLHVEGHALASLTLPNTPKMPSKVGDSVTLPLSTWLGIASLPYVTLYRAFEASAVHAAGLTSLTLQVRLASLPLWMILQTLGQSGFVSRVQHGFELSQRLLFHLSTMNHIRLLSPCPPIETLLPIQDLISKPITTTQLFENACGTVVFQYVEDKASQLKNSDYYNSLNSWLGQVVRREVGNIPLELVQLESAGFVLRWSPLEGPYTQHISIEDVDFFIQSLEHQIAILNATVSQRDSFELMVKSLENLCLVEIPLWAGLGGVRYIPSIYAKDQSLMDSTKDEVNKLNEHLVNQLKCTDSAFSLGDSSEGLSCIRFGMVTAETDIKELLSLVVSTGKEIESSSEYLNKMTEVVKKGIEKATADLQKENEERLWQEGLLRHVPIVGSVYNWLIPPPPPGIKGRTLDLANGQVESTENTYIYHMQIRHSKEATSHHPSLPNSPDEASGQTPSHEQESPPNEISVGQDSTPPSKEASEPPDSIQISNKIQLNGINLSPSNATNT